MSISYEGKVAVVTGGAGGIGREYASRLAADGADVEALDVAHGAETAKLVEQRGCKSHTRTEGTARIPSEDSAFITGQTIVVDGGIVRL